jgi:hypothetical protein
MPHQGLPLCRVVHDLGLDLLQVAGQSLLNGADRFMNGLVHFLAVGRVTVMSASSRMSWICSGSKT